MNRLLIDTDVILDFFFDRAPFAEHSAQIIGLCEAQTVNGYVSPVIVSNTYYLLRQTARHEKVIDSLKQLLSFMHVLQMDKGVVISALNSKFKDFEDALQNFAATRSGEIDVIITRNAKDYSKSQIAVLTPEDFIKSLDLNG